MKLHQVCLLLTCSHTHSPTLDGNPTLYEISQTKFRLINLWQTTQWRHTQVSLACPSHPLAVLSSPKQTQSSSLIHHPADWTSSSQLGFHPWQFVRSTAQTLTVLAFVNIRDMLFSMQYPLMANDNCLGMGKGEVQLEY